MPLNGDKYDMLVSSLRDEWNVSGGTPISSSYIDDLIQEMGVLCPPRRFVDIPLLGDRDNVKLFKDYAYERCISLKRVLSEKYGAMDDGLRSCGFVENGECPRFDDKVLKRVNEHLLHAYIEMHVLSGYECTDRMILYIHKYRNTEV